MDSVVLRIHDILVRIRIRISGPIPLINGSEFVIDLQDAKKNYLKKSFSAYYFLNVLYIYIIFQFFA